MVTAPDILCIGAVHWDIIGRSPARIGLGADVPGRIIRRPGGVAMNVAASLRGFGLAPALLTAIGRDAEGEELVAECRRLGLETAYVYRPDRLPTDCYVAVEGANGLIAAIADARTLEAAGARILRPLEDGRLGSAAAPWRGTVALDGNLPEELTAAIAASPLFAAADLRLAAASPAKAERLRPFLGHGRASFYLNLEEAEALLGARAGSAPEAAEALTARGAARALVTDGRRTAAAAEAGGVIAEAPPEVPVARVTGAGDTFMAAHIAAGWRGERGREALASALSAAAAHVAEAEA
ncbi:MAG: PfkB family carbohydrate kinase [Paracoccaceae bacterium]|nr:PfkB family carbohydrate kinase [Paracoccaceae bacterium]